MCQKVPSLIRFYAVIHHPTHMARPVVLGVTRSSLWSDQLFKNYVAEADETIKKFGGGTREILTKRDIERWGCNVPTGARAQVIEFDLARPIF